MNKNVQIILSFMLVIGLSNPFIEFDKSFLYNNNSDEEKLEDLNHNTKSVFIILTALILYPLVILASNILKRIQ